MRDLSNKAEVAFAWPPGADVLLDVRFDAIHERPSRRQRDRLMVGIPITQETR